MMPFSSRERHRQMLPVQHVAADGVPPAHVPPLGAERVVLVEEVVLALVVDEPVGIVHEVARRREVEPRPQRLVAWLAAPARGERSADNTTPAASSTASVDAGFMTL